MLGKPVRISPNEARNNKVLVKKFREACSWMSFTFNRDEIDWKYEVLICKYKRPLLLIGIPSNNSFVKIGWAVLMFLVFEVPVLFTLLFAQN